MQTLQCRRLAVSRAHVALGPTPAGSRYDLIASLEGKLYPGDACQRAMHFLSRLDKTE
jgi:hypothetical protein